MDSFLRWLRNAKLPLKWCVLWFCLLQIGISFAAPTNVRVDRIFPRHMDGGLSAEVKLTFSDYQVLKETMDKVGGAFIFVYDYRFVRVRSLWWDELLSESRVESRVWFNPFDKKYRIEKDGLTEVIPDFSQVIQRLSNPVPVRLVSLYRLEQGKLYQMEVRLSLSDQGVPRFLQIDRINNKDWFFDSDWYRQYYQLTAPIEDRSKGGSP
jgi:hypothetical protein